LSNDEKLDRLTNVLTLAGSDVAFAIGVSFTGIRKTSISEVGEIAASRGFLQMRCQYLLAFNYELSCNLVKPPADAGNMVTLRKDMNDLTQKLIIS